MTWARGGWGQVLAAMLALLMLGAIGLFVLDRVLERTKRNNMGVEVSCLVLVQVIRDSGANVDTPSKTPAGIAARRLRMVYERTLFEQMPPKRRKFVLKQAAIINKAGGSLIEPRCAEIAKHPGRVRRETLQKP